MNNASKNLAPINDLTTKVFDEILDERFSNIDLDCLLVTIIDNVPSDALPHLAEQYHVMGYEGWLQAQTETEKRELIKNAIKIHRYRGTKFAVKKVLEILSVKGTVLEWFESGYNSNNIPGNPYYFKIKFNVINSPMFREKNERLVELVERYKNVRSHLEALEWLSTAKTPINIATIITTSKKSVVLPLEI